MPVGIVVYWLNVFCYNKTELIINLSNELVAEVAKLLTHVGMSYNQVRIKLFDHAIGWDQTFDKTIIIDP
jgi:hypothetical protein